MENFYQMLVIWVILLTVPCSVLPQGGDTVVRCIGSSNPNFEIEKVQICDWKNDCPGPIDIAGNAWDEQDCNCPDPDNQFECVNRMCIPRVQRCDGVQHCPDNTDELNCPGNTVVRCIGSSNPNYEIEEVRFCDGKNDCPGPVDRAGNAWDEKNCFCPDNQFMCGNKMCIPIGQWCDGVQHCPDNTDELYCRNGEKLESTESGSNEQDSNESSSHNSKSAEIDSNESFSSVEKMLTLFDTESDELDSNEEYSKERIPIKFNSYESNSFEDYNNENQFVENILNGTYSNNLDLDKSESNESNTTVEKTWNLNDVHLGELDSNEEYSNESIPSKFNSNESNSLEGYSNENKLVEYILNGTHIIKLDFDEFDSNETNTTVEKTWKLNDVHSGELDSNEEYYNESIPSKFNSNESNSLEGYSNENQLVEYILNGTHLIKLDFDESDSNETNTKKEDISKEETIVDASNIDLLDRQRLLQLEIGFQQMKDNVLELTESANKGEQAISKLREDLNHLQKLLSQKIKDINYDNFTVSTAPSA